MAPKPHASTEPDQIIAFPYEHHRSFQTLKQVGRCLHTHPLPGTWGQAGDYTVKEPGIRITLLRASQSNTSLLWLPAGKLLRKQQISLLLLFLIIPSNPTYSRICLP